MTDQHKENQANTVKDQAREWLIYLYSGETTQKKRDEFVIWVNKNDVNRQAFSQSYKVWQSIGATDSSVEWLAQYTIRKPTSLPTTKSKSILTKSALWLSGIAASALFLVVNNTFQAPKTMKVTASEIVFTSPIGENKTVTLSDGTAVTLAGNSSILVDINQHERRISLRKGSAYFDVTHDSERVFSVSAQHTEVRVRGTAFEVEYSTDNELKISVQRGLVDVADLPEYGSKDEKVVQLHPNQQLRADIHGAFVNGVTNFDPETEFSWLNSRLIYDNIPLKNVIVDINRYVTKPIIVSDESINHLPITASFTFDQIDSVLSGLVAAYPIKLTEEVNRTVITKINDKPY
ncbi:FecR family protein [Colwellia sp. 20A7]|uniref:FecR family protein n=1 Tax=Colwellia sp. 20A7 TaxID=2689569 RepID=UPI00135B65AA|nr:FecR domain-containing protein [Colwellia sp. 20A7]